MKIFLVFTSLEKEKQFSVHPRINCRRRKISRMDFPYQLFFLLFLASSSIQRTKKKRRLCKKRTEENMSMEFSCSFSQENFFKDKRLLNMRNTSEFLPLHDLFLFRSSLIVFSLVCHRVANEAKIPEIFHVPFNKKSMFIRPGVKENL